MQPIVAEPVVASRIVESNFKLRPRTIEGVGTVDISLDQHWNAAVCTKYTQSFNQSIDQWITKSITFGEKTRSRLKMNKMLSYRRETVRQGAL